MPPAEGQQTAVASLLQGSRERGEGDAEAHHAVAVHNSGHKVQVGYLDIVVDQFVDLRLRQFGEAVEVFVCGIQQMEHLAAPAFVNQFAARELVYPQAVALLYHLRQLAELVGHSIRHTDLHLKIVVVLDKSIHPLHVKGVVGIVVVDVHRGQLVEALYEHALAVGIDESHGADDLRHPFRQSPRLDSLQQGLRHLDVVDEVEPAEANLPPGPSLIGTTVDDGSHAPHHLLILESQEILSLAALERRVPIGA